MNGQKNIKLASEHTAVNMKHNEGLDYSVLLQTFGTTKFRSVCSDADKLRKSHACNKEIRRNVTEGLMYVYYQLLLSPLAEGIRKSPLQRENHKHRNSSEVICC